MDHIHFTGARYGDPSARELPIRRALRSDMQRICKDNAFMWLPKTSLIQIREFYNKGHPIILGVHYVGGRLFFAAARNRHRIKLEKKHRDRYVRDILSKPMLNRIKEEFRLHYYEVTYDDCIILNNNDVSRHTSASVNENGEGETIELTVGKTYSKSSRVYIPVEFARLLLPAGVDSTWTVIEPSPPKDCRFIFKFVRNESQNNSFLFSGEWRQFCSTYKPYLRKTCLLKILSMSNRIMQASFRD